MGLKQNLETTTNKTIIIPERLSTDHVEKNNNNTRNESSRVPTTNSFALLSSEVEDDDRTMSDKRLEKSTELMEP